MDFFFQMLRNVWSWPSKPNLIKFQLVDFSTQPWQHCWLRLVWPEMDLFSGKGGNFRNFESKAIIVCILQTVQNWSCCTAAVYCEQIENSGKLFFCYSTIDHPPLSTANNYKYVLMAGVRWMIFFGCHIKCVCVCTHQTKPHNAIWSDLGHQTFGIPSDRKWMVSQPVR